ncbi:MAG: zinc ribbon domain-containing protein [Gemmatimonadota bacterium]
MPTYEYRCPDGHAFELFQRMSDPPSADCPECGKSSERLLSSGAGFLFKGDGFYITDYRSDSYKKAAEADKGRSPDKSEGGTPAKTTPAPAPSESKASSPTPSSGASTGGNSKSD